MNYKGEYGMTVSLCVVAYNEERFLPTLLDDLKNQTYSHKATEIILVDGGSEDSTKKIMSDFKKEYESDYIAIKVLDNPKRNQAAGWNVAITNATSDVIIRIDAHTRIPTTFTEKNILLQEAGEFVTGGVRPCLIEEPTPWRETLLEVENALFGSGIADSRHCDKKKYVKSMFHAAYRRSVFDRVGLFNEKLLRTEDNEMHYRIRKAGYKLCFDPEIISYQFARSSLKKMIKQKYGNGYWIGITIGICPKCTSVYHFVPCVFVCAIIFTTLLWILGIWQLACLMWSAYFIFTLVSMFITIKNGKWNRWTFCMPFLFLILHICYGVGTLVGLFNIKKLWK